MIKKSMVVKLNGKKADAMPAAMLVQVASQYESSIYVDDADKRVNAKSIMGMMTLGLANGLEIVVTAKTKTQRLPALRNISASKRG